MDNAIDQETEELLRRYADDQQREVENMVQRRAERRIEARDKLRVGDLPDHLRGCAQCVRAILALDHDAACEAGKRFPGLIFPQSKDIKQ